MLVVVRYKVIEYNVFDRPIADAGGIFDVLKRDKIEQAKQNIWDFVWPRVQHPGPKTKLTIDAIREEIR